MKQMESFVRIFVTSRPHLELQARLSNTRRIEISARDSDIRAYLKSEINTNNRLCKFTAKHPKLEEEIVRSVNENSAGM